MKITFYLRYHTQFGQHLHLTGNIDELGNNRLADAVPMQYLNGEFWQAAIDTEATAIQYSYLLTQADGSQVTDGEHNRSIAVAETGFTEIQAIDSWNDEGANENLFFTAPFLEVLLPETETRVKAKPLKVFTHIFKVKVPLLQKHEVVFMSGSGIALGNWKQDGVVFLTKEGNWWTVKLELPHESFPLQYKYGLYNTKEKEFIRLEAGENRFIAGNASRSALTLVHDGFIHLAGNTWKAAGVAIPVFSLRSKNSFGTGEFTDLQLLADWAKEAGLKVIQVLPVNDTTATYTFADSYPYAAISAFALHPLYINLEKVAGRKHAAIIKPLKKKQKQLNDLPHLDYEQVMKFKLSILRELCQAQKSDYLDDPDFYRFYTQNKHWLTPYAAFSYLRDKNGTADSSQWKTFSKYNQEEMEKLVSHKAKHYDAIFFHYFVQYHLHLQLRESVEYTHKKGIILKGDIAIGVYRYSCDAWMNPDLFNMDMQAGAPPDDFAVKGQNWGFPTYNWLKMQENGFAWWRQRFEQMSNYFDAFRIDHILGFFRIWSIPLHAVEGILGYFVPAVPVHADEFSRRGIRFEVNRYTLPFITDGLLQQTFGNLAPMVKESFLEAEANGGYMLKEAFNTQRKVEAHFVAAEDNDQHLAIKTGLFDLLSDVILFQAGDGEQDQFHFRIDMEKTWSFKNLDAPTQHQLKELYIDYFYRRQDGCWKQEAMKKLPALKAATNMLVCGEDLGMVPACVPEVMKQLGILSLEIQRMPKDPNREFFHPNDAPYQSVVTPSTHDMSTIRGWWEENRVVTQRFFNKTLGQWGEAPVTCEAWISKAVIIQHLYSPALLSIFLLQDLFGMSESLRRDNAAEERINIPANPKHYWRYRMHCSLEHLLKEKAFNTALKSFIHNSGR